MTMHAAIEIAVTAALAEATDLTEDSKKQLRHLLMLVLTGNYEDSDVRNVMKSIHVNLQAEE